MAHKGHERGSLATRVPIVSIATKAVLCPSPNADDQLIVGTRTVLRIQGCSGPDIDNELFSLDGAV